MPVVLYWGIQVVAVLALAAFISMLLSSLNQKIQKRTYRKQQLEDFTHKAGLNELAKARARYAEGSGDEVARVVTNPPDVTLPWEVERDRDRKCRHGKLMTQSCYAGMCMRGSSEL